jgi:hypothetical protein
VCFGPKLDVSVLTSSYSTFEFVQDPIYHHNFHETQRAHLNQQGHTNYLSQFSGFNGGKQQGYEVKLSGQFFPTAQQDSSLSNVTEKHFTIPSKKSKVENR